MLKILTTLIRGAAAEAEEAVFDANAIRVLEQQLRDAASAMELSRRELACAMAHRASESRAAEAVAARIAELESSAGQALQGGREDLAEQAATVIAANEDERAARQAAIVRFDIDIGRLRIMSDTGRQRLQELRRGLEMARAQEALHRAGANGRRALKMGTGALRDAEATLARIRDNHAKGDDLAAAMDDLEAQASGRDLNDQLSKAGFGPNLKTKPSDVMARLTAKTATADASDAKAPKS
jgi:phage shock protein A